MDAIERGDSLPVRRSSLHRMRSVINSNHKTSMQTDELISHVPPIDDE
jgi:hypothetical protein